MQRKITEELLNEIKEIEKIEIYLHENRFEMSERSLREQLASMLREKGLEKSAVIAASGLNVTYAYQIFDGKRNPSGDKVIALAFGLKASLAETQRLLNCSGNAGLNPRNKRDSVIIFCICKGYSLMELNELLYELKLPLPHQSG